MHKCSRCGAQVKTIRYDANPKHCLFMCVNENCTFPFDLDNFEDYLCEDDISHQQEKSSVECVDDDGGVPNDVIVHKDDNDYYMDDSSSSTMNKREIIELSPFQNQSSQQHSDNIVDLFKEYF
ncbi:hypothetical protein FDP41_010951 [Naegleria fowleri]|uniref:Uncharacterized protein n=1 Tax=Naegleria fowleri TaxID=5763 RepID=A0A6A5BXY6_NAEFO|nr:uncharacterized protein FDP41_010951 [Naegleria fowleri]KAF0982973.1 hypothetical protein FDP41_010951 [Naegleria fowleri]